MRRHLLIGLLSIGFATACNSKSSTKADNTGRNQRDIPTADKAVATRADLDTTQKIRKAVIDDNTLSTNAHNVKIIVQEGVVTLAGPVADQAERTKVEELAVAVVGDKNKVSNQLEVTN